MAPKLERLSGMDASFLYAETPSHPLHVACVLVVDPSRVAAEAPARAVTGRLLARMAALPVFRRRPRPLPLGLGHPVWEPVEDLDPALHLHRVALPAPGGPRELAEVVAEVAERPLDRARPLWELWSIEGLAEGHLALVLKLHHATVDGAAGVGLMAQLFDLSPDAAPPCAPVPCVAETHADAGALWREALRAVGGAPARLRRAAADAASAAAGLVRTAAEDGDRPMLPFTAPAVPWGGAISSRRSVAFGRATLADARRAAQGLGVKVNDVVLASCTLALRRHLEERGALPDRPLVASVPVAVAPSPDDEGANHVSTLLTRLPVQLADPLEILQAVHRETERAKHVHAAFGAHTIMHLAELAPPALVPVATRLYQELHLAELHPPAHNLVVSNVAGPRTPLFVGGAPLVAAYPLGPVLEGAGLNLTVLSHGEAIDFGAIGCRRALPDLEPLALAFGAAVAELAKRASPAGRRARTKRAKPSGSASA